MDAQKENSWIQTYKEEIIQEPDLDWTIGTNGDLRMKGGLVFSDIPQLKELFDEAHCANYTVYPGTTKMCKDLKMNFWWKNTREDVAEYVTTVLPVSK